MMRVRTIAPLIGCRFDDSLDLDGVYFRKMNSDDIATMAMIEWNFNGQDLMEQSFGYDYPVVVLDHCFVMVANPNDYSFNESMYRLHNAFKDRCFKVLAAIRLAESSRIGFDTVYHLDSTWINFRSFRFITEDASPIYRPLRFGKHQLQSDEFMLPKKYGKDSVIGNYRKIDGLYSIHSTTSQGLKYLKLALEFYSKSMEEHDIGWAILDLVIALESLCNFRKVRSNGRGLCDSQGAINRALGPYTKSDLVKRAYEIRSRRLAHSPQSSVSIDPSVLLPELRDFLRDTILSLISFPILDSAVRSDTILSIMLSDRGHIRWLV